MTPFSAPMHPRALLTRMSPSFWFLASPLSSSSPSFRSSFASSPPTSTLFVERLSSSRTPSCSFLSPFFPQTRPFLFYAVNSCGLSFNISCQRSSPPLATAFCVAASSSCLSLAFSCSAQFPCRILFFPPVSVDVPVSLSSATSSVLHPPPLLRFYSTSSCLFAADSSPSSFTPRAATAPSVAVPAALPATTSYAVAAGAASFPVVSSTKGVGAGVYGAPASSAGEAALEAAPLAAVPVVASACAVAPFFPSELAPGAARAAASPIPSPRLAAATSAFVAMKPLPALSSSNAALPLRAVSLASAPSTGRTAAVGAASLLHLTDPRLACSATAAPPFSRAVATPSTTSTAAAAPALSSVRAAATTAARCCIAAAAPLSTDAQARPTCPVTHPVAAAPPTDCVTAAVACSPVAGRIPRPYAAEGAAVVPATVCRFSDFRLSFSAPQSSSSTSVTSSAAAFFPFPYASGSPRPSFPSPISKFSPPFFFSPAAPFPFPASPAAPVSTSFPRASSSFPFRLCAAARLAFSASFSSSSSTSCSCALFDDEQFARLVVVGAGQMGAGIGITAARHLCRSTVVVMDTSDLQLQQAQSTATAYFKKEVARGRLTEDEALSCCKRLSFAKLEAAVFSVSPHSSKPCAASSLISPPLTRKPPIEACIPSSRGAAVAPAVQHCGSCNSCSSFTAASLSPHSGAAADLPALSVFPKEAVCLATAGATAERPAAAGCATAPEGEALSEAAAVAASALDLHVMAPLQQQQQEAHPHNESACKSGSSRGVLEVTKRQQEQEQEEHQQKELLFTEVPAFLREATFCIEAVWEDVTMKRAVFKYLDEITPSEAVLASNTSSISITKLAAATKRPEKVVGMHFMNPVPVMPLVEIIPGLCTSAATLAATEALASCMQKVTARALDRPGFIANRLLMPYLNEAIFALQEGISSAEEIDRIMKLGTNVPLGPLELSDFIGLDVCLSIMRVLHEALGEAKYRPAPLLVQHVDAGFLGRKTGRGFYNYEGKKSS